MLTGDEMGLFQLNFEGKNKIEVAIQRLQQYEPSNIAYYGAFSGGKDSVTVEDLSVLAEVPVDWHYCVSPIDPPQVRQFIKEEYPNVQWDYHARNWWKLVVEHGLPLRQARWCCQYIKEAGGEGRTVILGNHSDEGANRKHQPIMDKHSKQDKVFIRPIIDWTTAEVWEYIYLRNLPYCHLYDEGFHRLGCVLCPFNRNIKRELEYFPKIALAYQRACDRIIAKAIASGRERKHKFQTGQELWEWWIQRD